MRTQLAGAPRDVVLLTAELLYLQVLPLTNVRASTKRERVTTVLSWLDPEPVLPAEMSEGLATAGVFHGGVGFNIQIWQQLLWLCRFVSAWQELPEEDRNAALTDPWAFRRVAAATPGTGRLSGTAWSIWRGPAGLSQ